MASTDGENKQSQYFTFEILALFVLLSNGSDIMPSWDICGTIRPNGDA